MSMDPSTEALLRSVHATSYRPLVGQLYALCGSLAEAEDVVQEAFVRAAQHHRTFAAVDNPQAWLRTVAVNLSRSRWRRELRRTRAQHRRVVEHDEVVAELPGLGGERVDLVAALRRLPRDQREALVLHHLVDLPVDEVAVTLGANPNTVKARLRRGRQALAALLEDQADPDASADRPDRPDRPDREEARRA
jgi:RNA polymerase sigma-70 factor, ECF subfamily